MTPEESTFKATAAELKKMLRTLKTLSSEALKHQALDLRQPKSKKGITPMAEPRDEFLKLTERAIDVLKRHSKGLSDQKSISLMYEIFDGPECRKILELVPPARRGR